MKRGRPWTLKPDADAKPFSGRYRGHKIAGEDWKSLETERARVDRFWSAKIATAKDWKERAAVLDEELRLTKATAGSLRCVTPPFIQTPRFAATPKPSPFGLQSSQPAFPSLEWRRTVSHG
jgi:hypothetical protein